MNANLQAEFVQRGIQLELMGFSSAEVRQIVSAELTYAPTKEEWDEVTVEMVRALRDYELDEDDLNSDLNRYLMRSQWIQGQLLGVFNNMLRNYNAMSEGRMEHEPDPATGEAEPVIPVKPADIASMGEKILALDKDRLSAKLSFPGGMLKAQQALMAADTSGNALPGPMELARSLYAAEDEKAYDADFSSAE